MPAGTIILNDQEGKPVRVLRFLSPYHLNQIVTKWKRLYPNITESNIEQIDDVRPIAADAKPKKMKINGAIGASSTSGTIRPRLSHEY